METAPPAETPDQHEAAWLEYGTTAELALGDHNKLRVATRLVTELRPCDWALKMRGQARLHPAQPAVNGTRQASHAHESSVEVLLHIDR